jgi:cell wall-associated NlpC family hydrolase
VTPAACCAVDVAAVRREPRADAEQVTQLVRGENVEVEESRDGWSRIRTAYDYPGWVRIDTLAEENDPAWLGPAQTGDVLEEARAYLGAPYEWGGMTERGIDCSGLVHMAHRRLGHLVPRDAHQQEDAAAPIGVEELRPGDLVTYGEDTATHIAFWVGEGRILHATGRDRVAAVVEEQEPPELTAIIRRYVRLRASG